MSATQLERLELKYAIDERTADAIRREIAIYCAPDTHNAVAGGYPLLSLYFDTPMLAFHRAKLRGDPDRFKLRARVYDEGGPVHLEIKRKSVDVIIKTRVSVPRDGWADAARGFGAPSRDTPRDRRQLESFAHLLAQTGAEPKLLVRYEREAYESNVDEYARVTFDRRIAVAAATDWELAWHAADWTYVDRLMNDPLSVTVLELKCETRMPLWMMEIVRRFQLPRTGFSKYSSGVDSLALRALQTPVAWGLRA